MLQLSATREWKEADQNPFHISKKPFEVFVTCICIPCNCTDTLSKHFPKASWQMLAKGTRGGYAYPFLLSRPTLCWKQRANYALILLAIVYFFCINEFWACVQSEQEQSFARFWWALKSTNYRLLMRHYVHAMRSQRTSWSLLFILFVHAMRSQKKAFLVSPIHTFRSWWFLKACELSLCMKLLPNKSRQAICICSPLNDFKNCRKVSRGNWSRFRTLLYSIHMWVQDSRHIFWAFCFPMHLIEVTELQSEITSRSSSSGLLLSQHCLISILHLAVLIDKSKNPMSVWSWLQQRHAEELPYSNTEI